MYRYKRILVNLNLDDQDEYIIKNASEIARMAQSEKIYFLFTEKQMDIPEELIREYPQLTESAADFARDKIKENLDKYFEMRDQTEITIIVQEGQALDELLKQIKINGIDLVLFNVSQERPGSRNLATKLARKAACSVLVFPEKVKLDLSNAAVAVDFSENSQYAMDAAGAFIRAAKINELNMLHVYQVPSGFHKTGKSYDEFAEIMKNNAQQRFQDFISELNITDMEIMENYILNNKTVEALSKATEDKEITFLALGARGRGAGAAVMLGSVTEMLMENLDIPVLAVKKKGSGLNILNAIFN